MSIVRHTSITMAARYAANGAKALAALLVATTLGTAGAGAFALIRVWPHLATSILGGGFTIAAPYFIGSRRYPADAVNQTAVALGVRWGFVTYVGWVAASGLLMGRFKGELSHEAVLLVGLCIPFLLLRNYLNSIQQGLRSFTAANISLFIEEIATLLFMLPLFWFRGPESRMLMVLASVGGAAASCLAALIMLARDGVSCRPHYHKAIAREALPFGMKGHVGRMANMLTWRLDVLILSAFADVEVVGLCAVAHQAAELFRPLSASLTFVLRPLIAGLSLAEARVKGVMLYRRVFGLNLLMVLVMAAVGGPVIRMVFGEEFAPAIPAFQILLIGLAAHGADGVLAGYNVGIGRPEFNTYTALAGLVVTVVGDLLLIPPYGLIGAAVVSSIAYTVKAVTFTVIFLSTSGVSFGQLCGLKQYSPDAA
jgi:O-antigen/teichoic acid export membrane protein